MGFEKMKSVVEPGDHPVQMINLEELQDDPDAKKLLAIRRTNAEERKEKVQMKMVQHFDLESMPDDADAQKLLAIRRANSEKRRREAKSHEAQVFNLDDLKNKTNRTPEEDRYLALVDAGQAEEKRAKELRERIKNLKIVSGEVEVKPGKK